jgi:hypothetical protein
MHNLSCLARDSPHRSTLAAVPGLDADVAALVLPEGVAGRREHRTPGCRACPSCSPFLGCGSSRVSYLFCFCSQISSQLVVMGRRLDCSGNEVGVTSQNSRALRRRNRGGRSPSPRSCSGSGHSKPPHGRDNQVQFCLGEEGMRTASSASSCARVALSDDGRTVRRRITRAIVSASAERGSDEAPEKIGATQVPSASRGPTRRPLKRC